ncbi:MAG: DUF4921 family protein [Armatimonadetes bacterium]|nr:DUF4921 family protein [Armatimonadota bacterium]MDW8121222.1 DUF4921 family protein [Armatimonadota bacterium]
MGEIRKDPVVPRWVIIAEPREKRPTDYRSDGTVVSVTPKSCVLCPGNESNTPAEVYAIRPDGSPPNEPGWQVRVVPNKYPAVYRGGSLDRKGLGLLDSMRAYGVHEVIIETPDHDLQWDSMSAHHLKLVFQTFQARLRALRQDPILRYIVIFRNYKHEAGASLSHPHSQLIALPVVPLTPKEELKACRHYYLERERCLFCDLIYQEREVGKRIVYEGEKTLVLSSFAPRFPYELQILPSEHSHDFAEADESVIEDLAVTFNLILKGLKKLLNDPPYNLVLFTAPNPVPRPGRPDYWGTLPYDYHWHWLLLPRTTRIAGFELGSGFYIHHVDPERAAEELSSLIRAEVASAMR